METVIPAWLLPPHVSDLGLPLRQHRLGVEAQVERVVAQEAFRVHRSGKFPEVAALERSEEPGADLRVPLGTVQVNALALARVEQHLAQPGHGRGGGRGDGRAASSAIALGEAAFAWMSLVAGGRGAGAEAGGA